MSLQTSSVLINSVLVTNVLTVKLYSQTTCLHNLHEFNQIVCSQVFLTVFFSQTTCPHNYCVLANSILANNMSSQPNCSCKQHVLTTKCLIKQFVFTANMLLNHVLAFDMSSRSKCTLSQNVLRSKMS